MAVRFGKGLIQADRQDLDEISQTVPDTDYFQLQHFVTHSSWSSEALIQQIAQNVHQQLAGKERLLVIDEVGQPKKGDQSVGVSRQYCGNSGKIDNCQVSVAGYLTDFHQGSLVDMRLYLPSSWTSNPLRMNKAGIPAPLQGYASKIDIARQIIENQIAAAIDFDWVVADGFYGRDLSLGNYIDQAGKNFLLEVSKNRKIYLEQPQLQLPEKTSKKGRPFTRKQPDRPSISISDYCKKLTDKDFQKTRIRNSLKGNLISYVHTRTVYVYNENSQQMVQLRLLIRKQGDKTSFAFSNAWGASDQHLLKVQAWRYFIERAFQEAKNVVGMKHYQVRKYQAWSHYMAMILLLLLFLMEQQKELRHKLHPLISSRDIKLSFQWFLPNKCDNNTNFILRLIDNLIAKMNDYERFEHQYT